MKKWFIAILSISMIVLAACGDDAESEPEVEETPQGEACEHMVEGPAIEVEAADGVEAAPDATVEHTRVDLTLVDDGMGANAGYVTYAADETGEFYVFTSSDVAFSILDANENEVTIEATEAVGECDEVVQRHVVDLEVGTYTFFFGPTSDTAVSFVVEHAGEHEEHEE